MLSLSWWTNVLRHPTLKKWWTFLQCTSWNCFEKHWEFGWVLQTECQGTDKCHYVFVMNLSTCFACSMILDDPCRLHLHVHCFFLGFPVEFCATLGCFWVTGQPPWSTQKATGNMDWTESCCCFCVDSLLSTEKQTTTNQDFFWPTEIVPPQKFILLGVSWSQILAQSFATFWDWLLFLPHKPLSSGPFQLRLPRTRAPQRSKHPKTQNS